MKCNGCGAIKIIGASCPDCGNENLVAEAGGTPSQAPDANPGVQTTLMPAMPDVALVSSSATGPVIGTVVLPDARRVELRDGDELTIAHTDTDQEVTIRVDDESVSRTPVKIFARDGKMFATGGGGNGFSLVTTVRYKPTDEIEIPRSANVAVAAGKTTRLPIK